jgi:hypothetical protein
MTWNIGLQTRSLSRFHAAFKKRDGAIGMQKTLYLQYLCMTSKIPS